MSSLCNQHLLQNLYVQKCNLPVNRHQVSSNRCLCFLYGFIFKQFDRVAPIYPPQLLPHLTPLIQPVECSLVTRHHNCFAPPSHIHLKVRKYILPNFFCFFSCSLLIALSCLIWFLGSFILFLLYLLSSSVNRTNTLKNKIRPMLEPRCIGIYNFSLLPFCFSHLVMNQQ